MRHSLTWIFAGSLLLIAPAARAHTNVAYVGPNGTATTNGDKAVVDPVTNSIHVTYASNGQIYYVSSADSHVFTTPALVSGTVTACNEPAIAIDSAGTIGIIFAGGSPSNLYYTYRTGTTWSTPFNIFTGGAHGDSPAIVGYGTSVHLVFKASFLYAGVHYFTFPSTAPTLWSYQSSNHVEDGTLCGMTVDWFHPSIAVSGPTSTPVIQVAFQRKIDYRTATCTLPANLVGKIGIEEIVRRRTGTYLWQPDQFYDGRLISPCSSSANPHVAISNAIASDASGQYFLAWSDVFADPACPTAAAPRTVVARMDASNAWTLVTANSVIAPVRSYVDIAARNVGSTIPNVRITWAETTDFQGAPVYSTAALTRQRSAIWTGTASSMNDPSFTTNLNLTSSARAPQSIWYTSGGCDIPALLDRYTSSTNTYRVHLWSISWACIIAHVSNGSANTARSSTGHIAGELTASTRVLVPVTDSVLAADVDSGVARGLLAKIADADNHLLAGRGRQAQNALDAFNALVNAQTGRSIDSATADEMLLQSAVAAARIDDPCSIDHGGCDVNAACSAGAELGTAVCVCSRGYAGDGMSCFSTCGYDARGICSAAPVEARP